MLLPESLREIREVCFSHCTSLERVDFNDALKSVGEHAFQFCTSLKRVEFGKNLKVVKQGAFHECSKLEDVQLASKSTSFSEIPSFAGCDRLIEVATAAGFPSVTARANDGTMKYTGDGVVPYLIGRFERSERKLFVLLAHMRFKNAVHTHDGTEEEKVAAAQKHHPRCQSHPASPARPNVDRQGSSSAAPATRGRTSATSNASSTAGRSTRSRANERGNARSWTTARTR